MESEAKKAFGQEAGLARRSRLGPGLRRCFFKTEGTEFTEKREDDCGSSVLERRERLAWVFASSKAASSRRTPS